MILKSPLLRTRDSDTFGLRGITKVVGKEMPAFTTLLLQKIAVYKPNPGLGWVQASVFLKNCFDSSNAHQTEN